MANIRAKFAPHLCAAIILVHNLSFYTKSAPMLRLIELSTCREYYAIHDPSIIGPGGFIEERLCKLDPIQWKVAWLHTLSQLLHLCCGKHCDPGCGALVQNLTPSNFLKTLLRLFQQAFWLVESARGW
jgi:hypothetical protein